MKIVKTSLFVMTAFLLMSFAYTPTFNVASNSPKASIEWKNEELDLGTIEHNQPVSAVFEFTNTGNEAIVITTVKPSCGCTGTDYEKKAIAPGKTSQIKATYNAASKGSFRKSISVITSASETPVVLFIKGTVI